MCKSEYSAIVCVTKFTLLMNTNERRSKNDEQKF